MSQMQEKLKGNSNVKIDINSNLLTIIVNCLVVLHLVQMLCVRHVCNQFHTGESTERFEKRSYEIKKMTYSEEQTRIKDEEKKKDEEESK